MWVAVITTEPEMSRMIQKKPKANTGIDRGRGQGMKPGFRNGKCFLNSTK
jgi:hypothetical protein